MKKRSLPVLTADFAQSFLFGALVSVLGTMIPILLAGVFAVLVTTGVATETALQPVLNWFGTSGYFAAVVVLGVVAMVLAEILRHRADKLEGDEFSERWATYGGVRLDLLAQIQKLQDQAEDLVEPFKFVAGTDAAISANKLLTEITATYDSANGQLCNEGWDTAEKRAAVEQGGKLTVETMRIKVSELNDLRATLPGYEPMGQLTTGRTDIIEAYPYAKAPEAEEQEQDR